MQCPACASENPDGNRFCGQCGGALPDACTACGTIAPAGNKFCGHCGHQFGSDQGQAPDSIAVAASQPIAIEKTSDNDAERRHLTVMFCDLVGSTALSEALDPEDLRDVIGEFQQACAAQVDAYGGFVARYMGDGMLVYFGYPQAHEDDAERAVRAGLNIVDQIKTMEPRPGLSLQVRVGVATGHVVAGDVIGDGASEERAVLGVTPNLAARLQSLAAPDNVIISDQTRRLTQGYFEFDDLGMHDLKGISEPAQAWCVRHESSATSRFEATTVSGMSPLVGREEEIALLMNRWRQSIEGEGQVVMLSGEAGVGKSRILQAFRERIKGDDHGVIFLSCSPFHTNTALYPVIDCLERVMGINQTDSAAIRLEKLTGFVVQSGLNPDDIVPDLVPVLAEGAIATSAGSQTPEQRRRMIAEALLALLETQALRQPLVMIGEDTHWIDPSTEEFLSLLIERLRSLKVLLIMTARPHYTAPWTGHPHVTTLALNRLSRADCVRLIEGVTGGMKLPDEVVDQIVAKTDGVPLFAEELTKTVMASDRLIRKDDHFEIADDVEGLEIPASLHDSLMARLDQMGQAKEVAQLAAVLGRQFGGDLLAAVSRMPSAELARSLDQLVEAQVIVRRSLPPSATYEFKHALVQDTAYESLLKKTRQRHHLDIANALEGGIEGDPAAQPEILAQHYTRGGAALKAVPCWRDAARRATEKWASAEAVSHVRRGLKLIEKLPDDSERADIEIAMLFDLVAGLRILDRYDDAFEALDRAQATAIRQDKTEDLARVHYLRGNIYFPQGNIERCLEEHNTALDYARQSGSVELEARALSGLGDGSYLAARVADCSRYYEDCVNLAHNNGLYAIEAVNKAMLGHMQLYNLVVDQARTNCLDAAELAVSLGNDRAEMVARGSCAGKVLFELGELELAKSQCEQAVEISRRLGARRFEPINQTILAMITGLEGNRAGAEEIAQNGVQISRETGLKFSGPMILGALAETTDDEEVRRKALAEGTAILGEGCVSHNYFWFYRSAMETMIRAENWPGAEAFAEAAEDYMKNETVPWLALLVARARALADVGANGRSASSIERVRKVSVRARELGLKVMLPALEEVLAGDTEVV